jgi:hypothetical protein
MGGMISRGQLYPIQEGMYLKPEDIDYSLLLDDAVRSLTDISLISTKANEQSQTVLIVFKMDSNELWLAEQNMKAIVKAIQPIGTNGYRLRMAAKMENGLTGLTITLSWEAVAALDCSADVVDWEAVADEYHIASGLK